MIRAALRAFLARARALVRRDRAESDLQREIASHLAEATEEFLRRGLSPPEARRAALRSFGGVTQATEDYREGLGWRWLDTIGRESRQAVRSVVRTPGFALVVITILGIGTGGVTAAFTLVNGVVLQPLPYAESGRLVAVEHTATGVQLPESGVSTGLYFLYGTNATSIESIGGYSRTQSLNVRLPAGEVERVQVTRVTASLFHTLRAVPAHGRLFTDDDGAPGFMNARWAIPTLLAHGFWMDRLGGDPSIVGRTILINESPRLVVGVMRPGFGFPDRQTQIWMLTEPPRATASFARSFDLRTVARLRTGATIASATVELSRLLAGVTGKFPDATPERVAEIGLVAHVRPFKSVVIGDIGGALWPLLGGMLLLLAIACANAATLFAVRAEHRRRETAVRLALGAGGRQIARAHFLEALVITVTAAAVGLGLARASLTAAAALSPVELPRADASGLTGISLVFALVLAISIAAFYSALSMRSMDRTVDTTTLRSGQRTTGATRRRFEGLLSVQVALALVLMSLSGLMVRTYVNLSSRPLGFSPDNTLTMEVGLPSRLAENHVQIYRAVLDEVRRVPGVEDVGAASYLPLTPSRYGFPLHISSTPVAFKFFMPGYFQTMGTPIVEGDGFPAGSGWTAPEPVLISARLARRLFGRESAVGKPLQRMWEDGSPVTQGGARSALVLAPPLIVVGVVGDVREASLRDEPTEMVYVPIIEPRSEPSVIPTSLSLVVRSAIEPLALSGAVTAAVRRANPSLSIARVQELREIVDAARAREAFVGALLLSAALVAFALGLVGIHGSVAQLIRNRTQEIGIRIALGAGRREVIELVASRAVRSVIIGAAIGLGGALLATPILGSLLFGVAPRDPLALAGACAALLCGAIAAAWLAGLRATRLPVTQALRGE